MKKPLLTLALLAAAAAAHAGVILSDDFNYPDGGIVTNSGTWVANTGVANTMLVSNSTLIVTTSRAEDILRLLAGQPYMTNGATPALYASFKAKWTELPTISGTYFTHFTGESTTLHRARVTACLTNLAAGGSAPAGFFYLVVGNNSPSGTIPFPPVSGQWGSALTTNVTYKIVTRIALASGASTLWVDPESESSLSVTADDPVNQATRINAVYYSFRQASGEGTVLINDLKVGTAFNDVAGANMAPTISGIANQIIPAGGSTGPLSFTIDDAESPAASLITTATSDNPALVPNNPGNLAIAGAGAQRSITVTPAAGQQGLATITVKVSDGANTSFTTFQVQVGAPTISAIASVAAVTNTPVPSTSFTVQDLEGDSLAFYVASSNPALIPNTGVTVGGSGGARTVALTPVPGKTGSATITISVSDSHNTNSSSFTLTMRPVVGVIFDEPFNYTLFDYSGDNSLIMATGTRWTSVSGTAAQIQVTNGWTYLTRTNTEDVGAALNADAVYYGTNGWMFYASFPVNFSETPSAVGNYFFHLKASKTDTINFRGKVSGATAGAAPGTYRLGIANSANSPVFLPRDLSLNTTYRVVTRYNAATGECALWVDPASEASPAALASDQPGWATIGGVGLRQDSGIGTLTIGEIKIGTSFKDVATEINPESLRFSVTDGNLVLTWNNPALRLGSADNVSGPYTEVPGATSGYSTPLTGPAKFFGLLAP